MPSATACSRPSTTPKRCRFPSCFPPTATASSFMTGPAPAWTKKQRSTLDAFPSPEDLWARYRAWKGLTSEVEAIVLQDYFDDGSGKTPRYYQGQRHQRRHRSHRQGPRPHPARHGHGNRQDLYRVPDHLAAVEGRTQETYPVPGRPQRAGGPNDGQRLPALWSGYGQALDQSEDHRTRRRLVRRSDHRR